MPTKKKPRKKEHICCNSICPEHGVFCGKYGPCPKRHQKQRKKPLAFEAWAAPPLRDIRDLFMERSAAARNSRTQPIRVRVIVEALGEK